jgi:hypothetical protein
MCKYPDKFFKATGQMADKCCVSFIMASKVTCDAGQAPCIMKASVGDSLDAWQDIMQGCKTPKCQHRVSSSKAAEKGDFLAVLFTDGTAKYQQAREVAQKSLNDCRRKVKEDKEGADAYKRKIASATDEDKEKNPLTGLSKVMKWQDIVDEAEAEVKFLATICKNAEQMVAQIDAGLKGIENLKAEAGDMYDIAELKLKADTMIGDASVVMNDVAVVNQQMVDSSKDYDCGAPPAVKHAVSLEESTICWFTTATSFMTTEASPIMVSALSFSSAMSYMSPASAFKFSIPLRPASI